MSCIWVTFFGAEEQDDNKDIRKKEDKIVQEILFDMAHLLLDRIFGLYIL